MEATRALFDETNKIIQDGIEKIEKLIEDVDVIDLFAMVDDLNKFTELGKIIKKITDYNVTLSRYKTDWEELFQSSCTKSSGNDPSYGLITYGLRALKTENVPIIISIDKIDKELKILLIKNKV